MNFPNFTDPQFVDANGVGGFNAAFSTVSGSVANAGSGLWAAPGLIAPESATISFSGMVATIGLAQPFGVVSVSGSLAHAHGTLTGQSTTTYSPDFSSLVPASGSVTAYAVAAVQQIQQNPFPIPGPPPGHPSFNPSFVPTVGYANNQQTLAVSATTTAADNVSTFELLRTTLTAGQASVTSWSTAGQKRAPLREAYPPLQLAAGGAIGAASACYTLMPSATGLTTTLPPTSGAAGIAFRLVNPLSGNWTIAAAGSDTIVAPGGAASSTTIPPSGSALVWADPVHGQWDMLGAQIFGALKATQTWNGVNTFDNAVTAPSFNPAGSAGYFGYSSGNTILVLGSSTYIQGASAGGSIVLVADGQVNTFATDGDITAARRQRSTSGAAGSGDGNACTILSDFPSTLGTTGIKKYPDPNSPTGYFIEQWFVATHAAGTGTYNFPVAFPNAALSIAISPGVPCNNVQAAGVVSASQYQVQNNYSGDITSYVVAKGY